MLYVISPLRQSELGLPPTGRNSPSLHLVCAFSAQPRQRPGLECRKQLPSHSWGRLLCGLSKGCPEQQFRSARAAWLALAQGGIQCIHSHRKQESVESPLVSIGIIEVPLNSYTDLDFLGGHGARRDNVSAIMVRRRLKDYLIASK